MPSFQEDVHQIFARFFGEPDLEPLIYLLSKKMSEGHVCLPLSEFLSDQNLKNGNESNAIRDRIKKSPLIAEEPQANAPFYFLHDCIYLQRYWKYERNIVEKILQLINYGQPYRQQRINTIRNNWSKVQSELLTEGAILPDWQLSAVITCAVQQFSIITGGPGTGKTTTVRKLLYWFFCQQPDIQVAIVAPTGKAAMRMGESLKESENDDSGYKTFLEQLNPSTIHRLLKYKKDSLYFHYNEQNVLPYDLIIVDECSMIDVSLMSKLLSAISPHTQLILLGDKDQLAAVEAGSLFGDLCAMTQRNVYHEELIQLLNDLQPKASSFWTSYTQDHPLAGHITELMVSHRFKNDQGIGKWSKAIIKGEEDASDFARWNVYEDVAIAEIFTQEELSINFQKWMCYTQEQSARKALEIFNQYRILCATKNGSSGVNHYNKMMESILQHQGGINKTGIFYINRPVMLQSNAPELELFNGDVGLIRYNDAQQRVMVFFIDSNNQERWVLPAQLPSVSTAFAMTIHKSQGSEFNEVFIVLPDNEHMAILTRELLYTAVTRARNKVWLQGKEAVLKASIQKSVVRHSGIATQFNHLNLM